MSKAVNERTYASIRIGESTAFTVRITEELVDDFGRLSGDLNPLHMDQEYASATGFGRRVAHGMIVGALFSRLVGMYLPGKYCLYLSQTLRFHKPVAIGDELLIQGEVAHQSDAHKVLTMRLKASNAKSQQLLVSGDATVQLLR